MNKESCYIATPLGGGEPKVMSAAAFKAAFIMTSKDLGDGHFRHMATLERRLVNILQAPRAEVDALQDEPRWIATGGLDQ
ncbi:MAG: hypothetical protein V4795_11930 [Pseudomonadota bacterium]